MRWVWARIRILPRSHMISPSRAGGDDHVGAGMDTVRRHAMVTGRYDEAPFEDMMGRRFFQAFGPPV